MKNNNIIYLIGMPGSGKTYLGKKLANIFGYHFIDLDFYIETKENKTIEEIISENSESYFRNLEREHLLNLAVDKVIVDKVINNQKIIISCGGGLPCYFDNINLLKFSGKVIYLDTSLWKIYKRCLKSNRRPLFKNKITLFFKLLKTKKKRLPYYLQADYTIKL
ncbi:MAG: shikimate kinase [Erysipelotrichales bacterium]|nr:shikimate kinase [Erysipelotrichales bacterium]